MRTLAEIQLLLRQLVKAQKRALFLRFASDADREVYLKQFRELDDAERLARLELTPLQDTTTEADLIWEQLLERQDKMIWDVTAHPPVGKPYPPFETHITLKEAHILGLPLDEPHLLRGYPLVIDYEPNTK